MKFSMTTMATPTDRQLELRQQVLAILLKNFGDTASNRAIYECADEWCSKQVTSNGLINYFKTYYTKY